MVPGGQIAVHFVGAQLDQHGHFVVALGADELKDVFDPHDVRVEEAFAVHDTVVYVRFSRKIEDDVNLKQVVHCRDVGFGKLERLRTQEFFQMLCPRGIRLLVDPPHPPAPLQAGAREVRTHESETSCDGDDFHLRGAPAEVTGIMAGTGTGRMNPPA